MDDFEHELGDERRRPSLGMIIAILGLIGLASLAALTFMGGQVSSILSNVGNSITGGTPIVGSETTADGGEGQPQSPTDPDGKNVPIVDPAVTPPELLIIRKGTLEIVVADIDAAVSAARGRVSAVGGFSSASEEATDGDDATASVTFRIPAARWDDAVGAIRGLALETRHATVETEAVTSQVVDLGARITNLRASEAALQKIMEQATKIPDVLDVQAKLSDVRGEIERLVAQKGSLEEQAAMGTLTVLFATPAPPKVEVAKAGWDPAADADAASGALIKIAQRATSFGIWVVIVGLPLLAGLALTVIAAFLGWRVINRFRAEPTDA
ncbi:MAG TPA: DUF4349 domain-containing protein [Candidatus Limnocylindrales bacterium]|nr:DUF4349 domain-containing protein [Candidatus Limnocylindrales bacterium]